MLNKDPNLKMLSFSFFDKSEKELLSLSILKNLSSHLRIVAAHD